MSRRGAVLMVVLAACGPPALALRTGPCTDTVEKLAPLPKCHGETDTDTDTVTDTVTDTDTDTVTDTVTATATATATVAFDPHLFDRIAVLGASVSAGFSSPRVGVALQAALPSSAITDAADLWMFSDPLVKGAAQVDAALAAKPTMVVAIDFLFWYAYQATDAEAREASLERGLDQLNRLDDRSIVLAVGDLADMRVADPRMLPPAVVPPAVELRAMNARVRAWAAARRNTVVLPLGAWTAPLLANAEVELAPGETIEAENLLFLDRLHPNPLGLWYLLTLVDGALEAGLAVPAPTLVFARP